MQDEKWQDIIGRIKDDFEELEHETVELDPGPGMQEYIIFNGPLGKMKLERTTRPLVLDKKVLGSKRIGSGTSVEYIYSETEKIHGFKAYRWAEGQDDWVEMAAGDNFDL